MSKNNIRSLRNTIHSKLSKLIKNEKHEDIDDVSDNELEYELNDDIIREEMSYITDTKKISILYVDDETINLNTFLACFRYDFNIFLAHDTDLALDILNKEKIDIVITDQIMPKMTGIEFLTKVKSIFKKSPAFIILSAYVDTEMLIDAINNLQVFKFLNKPFDVDEIKKCVKEAYTYNLSK